MTHPGIANIFTRVLRIEIDSGALATAFTIEVGEKQYLVTARHVLPDQGPHKLKALGHTVEFVFEGTPVPGIPQNVDIAVFALPEAVTPQFPLPATLTGMTYAHDVYFYGYPYGLSSTAAGAERLPLVKRALMSAMLHDNGAHILYLDGFNNPGFSGGPVTFVPHDKGQLHVGAVISGYRSDLLEVKDAKSAEAIGALVEANTGIVVAYSIDHAVAAIEGRPAEIQPPPGGDSPAPVS
jgi:prepilin-type processing-associated H-X9-DG protein